MEIVYDRCANLYSKKNTWKAVVVSVMVVMVSENSKYSTCNSLSNGSLLPRLLLITMGNGNFPGQ